MQFPHLPAMRSWRCLPRRSARRANRASAGDRDSLLPRTRLPRGRRLCACANVAFGGDCGKCRASHSVWVMSTRAIIVGAGRGSRLTPDTDLRPKCLVDGLAGKTILDWTLEAFQHAGIGGTDVAFVGGYRIDDVRAAHPQLRVIHNTQWAENNVLESLMYARNEMRQGFLACYSDTVFRAHVVQRLVSTTDPVAVVVDRDWRRRYVGRTDHPESEAEKVVIRAEGEHVVEIGKHIAADRADGEFTGLVRFSPEAAQQLVAVNDEIAAGRRSAPFQRAPTLRQAYLTDMLQELISRGVQISVVDIWGDWVEIDTGQDLALARELLGADGTEGLAREFWAVRARDYAGLEWVRRDDYLRSEEHTSELQSQSNLVCRLLLEKKKR